jgi:hypothetical protein
VASAAPFAPSPGAGSPSGQSLAPEPEGLDEHRARARLAELLGGRTLEELTAEAARAGPDSVDDRPILLADPLRGLGSNRKRALLQEFERHSKLAPVVLVTSDPDVQRWAATR